MKRCFAASLFAVLLATGIAPVALAQETAPEAVAPAPSTPEQDVPPEVETTAADAAAAGTLRLELNTLATLEGGACQLTYVASNDSPQDLAQVAYQVGVFDAEGVVRRILVLEFGALAPGRTRIVLFNLAEQPCDDISRIIVNDLARCEAADGSASDLCMGRLETSSRTPIQFGL